MKNTTGILVILMILVVGFACSKSMVDSGDTTKVNKIIDEANNFITTANEKVKESEKKFGELETKIEDIKSNKKFEDATKSAKELFPIYDAADENFKKAAEKFEEAAKLKIHEKHREYLNAKAQEMKRRADHALENKKIPQAFVDSKLKTQYETDRERIKKDADKIIKEAKDLAEKAEQIRKENPDVIKQK